MFRAVGRVGSNLGWRSDHVCVDRGTLAPALTRAIDPVMDAGPCRLLVRLVLACALSSSESLMLSPTNRLSPNRCFSPGDTLSHLLGGATVWPCAACSGLTGGSRGNGTAQDQVEIRVQLLATEESSKGNAGKLFSWYLQWRIVVQVSVLGCWYS